MDGHFVPNLTLGAPIIEALRQHSRLFFDVHLMIERPELSLKDYVHAGADLITVHAEACTHLHRVLCQIRELGVQAGVALNPATPLSSIEPVLHLCDLVLLMTVLPELTMMRTPISDDCVPSDARKLTTCEPVWLWDGTQKNVRLGASKLAPEGRFVAL